MTEHLAIEPDALKAMEEWGAAVAGGNTLDATVPKVAALLSIALSLKRIADALTYQPVGSNNLFDFIREISEKRGA
jgi:hypothetical protein